MWEWQIDPAVTLTTALRVDRWSLGRKGSLPASYPLTNEDWDGAQTEPSFNAAVVWRVSDNDTVRFLAGRGVQLPNLVNLGGYLEPVPPFGFVTGVPDLHPTVVDSYELSWERSLPVLDAQLRVSAFRGHSHDIVAITGGRRLEQGLLGFPINLGDSRTNGLEASLKGALGDAWRWGVSYIRQEIDDEFAPELPVETAFTDFENTTPRHVLKANLGWARARWEVDGYVRHQSGTDGIVIEDWGNAIARRVPVSSYSAVDGRIGYAINERVTLALSGQNLGKSEQRQTAAPAVERVVFATVTVNLGSR
jgi:iron complex outermembrane receptor protein